MEKIDKIKTQYVVVDSGIDYYILGFIFLFDNQKKYDTIKNVIGAIKPRQKERKNTMTKTLTKKQNKKTLQTTAKNKKAVEKKAQPKAEKTAQKAVDFRTALKDTGDLKKALQVSKKQRADYLNRLMTAHKGDLIQVATRLGVGTLAPDNNPLKSDLRKLATISGNSKPADSITARMVYATAIAYLNRESDSGFNRVFPTGLFLENGILQRLFNAGLIKSAGGENEKQAFTFTEKAKHIITDTGLLKLEKQAIEGGLL